MKRESYYFQTPATDRLSELLSSGACVNFYTDMHMGSRVYIIEWRLWIDGNLFDSSGPNTLFYLPEFELDSLNQILEESSAQYHDGNHVSTEELKANLKARFGV